MKRITIPRFPFCALLLFAVALFPHDSAVSQDVRYPFTFPWNDSLFSGNAMRFFPRMTPGPAGRHGFLKVGNRFTFSDGTPARFTGVNFSFGASMADSMIIDQVAPRLAKFGVNVVRMHHMDNYNTRDERETLLDLPFNGAGTRNLNFSQVRRLAYTIYRLGEHGIYSNINLHVSRRFQAADGVANADSLPKYGKGVSIFDPVIRRLMKEYAANLLGYVNPYTGLRLADDPRVAFVEITNENSLVRYWGYGYLNYTEGSKYSVSLYHSRYLDSLWTQWLRKRYAGTAALNDAWSERSRGPIANMLLNGSFESEFTGKWEIEQHEGARARAAREPGGIDGAFCARIDIDTVTGVSWHIQVKQAGTARILRDSLYTVTFSAKASSSRSLPVRVMNNKANWEFYGLGVSANLETEWKTFQFSFRALATDTSNTRLAFNMGADTGTVWLDAVSFTVLNHDGLFADESLEKGTVRRVGGNEANKVTRKRLRDTEAFFIALQKDFFDDMYRFLKDSVGVKCPVAGTNSLGGLGDLFTQTGMDYIDNHAYWQHPRFPNRPWDAWDWYIPNTPMTADTSYGTMPRLSSYAVKGKPYVVSEYNHPAPSWYQCEMPLLLGAVASYQDWSAIYIYSYHHGHDDWDHEHINRYFDIDGNPTVLALLPQMSAMYRHGWIRPALRTVNLEFAPGDILAEALLPRGSIFFTGLPADTPLRFGLRVGSFQATETPGPSSYGVPPSTGTPVSDTGELPWKASRGESRFIIDAPKVKGVTGYLANITTPGGAFAVSGEGDFGTVFWTTSDDRDLASARRSFLAVVKRAENTGMIWDGDNTVHTNWGTAPVLLHPLRLTVTVSGGDSLHLYPLDSLGQADHYLRFFPDASGSFRIDIDQRTMRTPWFGIERFFGPTTEARPPKSPAAFDVALFPNPVGAGSLNVRVDVPAASRLTIEVFDILGRKLRSFDANLAPGTRTLSIPVAGLKPGTYMLAVRTRDGMKARMFTVSRSAASFRKP